MIFSLPEGMVWQDENDMAMMVAVINLIVVFMIG